jgi:hypothetical protein
MWLQHAASILEGRVKTLKFRIFFGGRLINPERIEFNQYGIQFEWFEQNGVLRQGRIFNEVLSGSAIPLISQVTAMTDKNGNDIWEGDIVRYSDGKEEIIKSDATLCASQNCEVVGNIYEKPGGGKTPPVMEII